MKLPKFIISIFNLSTREHVLEDCCAETATIAAYMVAENELGIEFDDNPERSDFDWDDVVDDFRDYGYSIKCIPV